eukprot:4734165-Pleurochrysis_carterae.AAC.2
MSMEMFMPSFAACTVMYPSAHSIAKVVPSRQSYATCASPFDRNQLSPAALIAFLAFPEMHARFLPFPRCMLKRRRQRSMRQQAVEERRKTVASKHEHAFAAGGSLLQLNAAARIEHGLPPRRHPVLTFDVWALR